MNSGQVQNVIRNSLFVNRDPNPGLRTMLYELQFTIHD